MKLVDLTRPLDPEDIHKFPESRRQGAATMVPEIEYQRPAFEGADAVCANFGCTREDLPDGEGWGAERLHINTHLGTHVDAPLHYGSTCEGKPARTITDIALDELYVDGLVVDLRGKVRPNEGIAVSALKEAIEENGAPITPGCALLLRTGQERYELGDREYFQYPGMTREGTLFLARTGAKLLCTDALGWDRPFPVIRRAFRETRDRSTIWDGHYAGREKEVFIVQQIHNLKAVPKNGFKVGFFPLPLARCSASPARVVAFVAP
ncbi:MAG: cyclase family protein [Myxococcales bacterium]|nr:cyclase family protein [Myxococcales bacterium]